MKPEDYKAPEGQQETLELARDTLKALNKKAGVRDNCAVIYANGTASALHTKRACLGVFTYNIANSSGMQPQKVGSPITYMLYQTCWDGDNGLGENFHAPDRKPLYQRYISWLMKESPFRHAFVEGDPDTYLNTGFILDARFPFDYLYQTCAAIRYTVEETFRNIVIWDKLQNMGVEPVKAFIMSHFLNEDREGLVKGKDQPIYTGHSVIPCAPALSSLKNFVAEDMVSFPKDGMCTNITKKNPSFNCWSGGVKKDSNLKLPWPKKKIQSDFGYDYDAYEAISWEAFKGDLDSIMKGFFGGKA